LPIDDALLTQNFAKIGFVYWSYANVRGFNAILAMEIFCYRGSVKISAKKQYFSTKFGGRLSNLRQIKCTKLYLD